MSLIQYQSIIYNSPVSLMQSRLHASVVLLLVYNLHNSHQDSNA